ncbi:restriction endonuclease subunit S [Pectinatus haikarae]|uniref:Type I restriction enzyme S subunit n=1 Tax=Pectinatus haikarae TaxID=349096 RepID=A0ABT9Y5K8_9FIRM|nr:restriction endonuclease subunit S [Pectinatus haikarae]MDQ0202846.1 type I restriction enzyme S subunit [Pectinatus haikarae]
MPDNKRKPVIRFKGFTDDWEQHKLCDETNSIDTGKSKFTAKKNGIYEILGSTSVIGYDDSYDYEGDFLLTARVGANAGELYRHSGKVKISDNTVFIKGGNLDLTFYKLLSFDIKSLSFGTGQPLVKTSELKQLEMLFPTSNEEKAQIGYFFTNLDNLITLHQRKYDKLVNIKKSMLEKMFLRNGSKVPEIRFKGFTDVWEQRKASELFISITDKSHTELPVLSATQDRGMIKRDENGINIFHNRKNEEGYKRVMPGQFVIHLRSFQGGFAHSSIEGITSPAYTVFGFKEQEKHDDNFWKYIFTSKEFIRRLETVTYGIRDGRSISYDDFLTLSFTFPSKAEQSQVAQYVEYLDNLITLHQRKLEKLKNIKKSCLEKMFV